MTSRQILDVFFVLIFISIVIYAPYLHLLAYTYLHLFTYLLIYLFILIFSSYYYVNLTKLLKYGEYRNYDKIF